MRVVVGDATEPTALIDLLAGVDAVVSALGPTKKEGDLHARNDRKAVTNKAISALITPLGGAVVKDKPAEYRTWAASGLDWTLVRPPRLADGPASSGLLEHDAHRSTRSTTINRADLGAFLVDVVEKDLYSRQAPFVASPKR